MTTAPLRRNIPLYYLSDFCFNLAFTTPVWVNFYRQYLSFTQISILSSAAIAVLLLLQVPTGVFADRVGRKPSIIIGALLWGFSLVATAFAQNGLTIFVAALLVAAGAAFVSGANIALVYDSLKEANSQKEFLRVRKTNVLLMQVAIIVSSFLAGYLFALWKGLPYLVSGLAMLAGGGISFFFYETKRHDKVMQPGGYKDQFKRGFTEIWKNQTTKYLSLFYILVGGITWAWATYFNQIYATSLGYSVADKGWLFAIIRFVNVIVIVRLLHLDRYVTKKAVYMFFPAIMLFAALLAAIPVKPLGTLLLFAMTLSGTMRIIVLDAYMNDQFASAFRATALSTLNMLVGFCALILIGVSGPMLDRFPAGLVYLAMGGLVLVAVVPIARRLIKLEAVTRV